MTAQVQNPPVHGDFKGNGPFSQISMSRSALAYPAIAAILAMLSKLMSIMLEQFQASNEAQTNAAQAKATAMMSSGDDKGSGTWWQGLMTGLGAGVTILGAAAQFMPSSEKDEMSSANNEKETLEQLKQNLELPAANNQAEQAEAPADLDANNNRFKNFKESIDALKGGNFLDKQGPANPPKYFGKGVDTFTPKEFEGVQVVRDDEVVNANFKDAYEVAQAQDRAEGTNHAGEIMSALNKKIDAAKLECNTKTQLYAAKGQTTQQIASGVSSIAQGGGQMISGNKQQDAAVQDMNTELNDNVNKNANQIVQQAAGLISKAIDNSTSALQTATSISSSASN